MARRNLRATRLLQVTVVAVGVSVLGAALVLALRLQIRALWIALGLAWVVLVECYVLPIVVTDAIVERAARTGQAGGRWFSDLDTPEGRAEDHRRLW